MEDYLTIEDCLDIYNETGLSLEEINELLNTPRVFDLTVEF